MVIAVFAAAPMVVAVADNDGDEINSRDHDYRKIEAGFDPVTPGVMSRDDDDDDDDGDGDGDGNRGALRKPAPAGTVAPPRNGLFGNGAPPQVNVR